MNDKTKLGYEDISIVPERISNIRHRSECNCYDENGMLPIFTAPMDNVVDVDSASNFIINNIYTILPRTISFKERVNLLISNCSPKLFFAFSLEETENLLINECASYTVISNFRKFLYEKKENKAYICIDIANGHMLGLIELIKNIKQQYKNKVVIMSGNIANPDTYRDYEKAGCDYVRANIGSGSRCTTSSNLGLHYASFSLIKDIWQIKQEINGKCKIIADGGIKCYRDIQKALLYADYVMIGNLFNKAIDSAGTPIYGYSYFNLFGKKIINPFKTLFTYGKKVNRKDYNKALKNIKLGKLDVWKDYYGMSSKKAQLKINPNAKLKTSEGFVKKQKVEYSLQQWIENEIDFLRSVMSYTNSKTLEDYKNSKWIRLIYRAHND